MRLPTKSKTVTITAFDCGDTSCWHVSEVVAIRCMNERLYRLKMKEELEYSSSSKTRERMRDDLLAELCLARINGGEKRGSVAALFGLPLSRMNKLVGCKVEEIRRFSALKDADLYIANRAKLMLMEYAESISHSPRVSA